MATASTSTAASGLYSYADCVNSLRTSLSFLESSVNTLGSGVEDFPRLISVLKTVRHYELIPQDTLAAAESSLRDEIGPFIALLLDRADRQLDRQARRIETLKARSELNAGRLSISGETTHGQQDKGGGSSSSLRGRGGGGAGGAGSKKLAPDAALRAKIARQRREALQYSVERLELEVVQKERELRVRLDKA